MLGGAELFIKRDDLLPLAGGGSKTRKLEYLVQAALDAGADTLVTCGAVQSNHCRLTASAAAREGLGCHLILEERVPGSYSATAGGNNYTFALLGATTQCVPLDGVPAEEPRAMARLRAAGKTPYWVAGGGSTELGSLGYARAALEVAHRDPRRALRDARVRDDEVERLRQARLDGMKKMSKQRAEWLANGHGEYREIVPDELTLSDAVVEVQSLGDAVKDPLDEPLALAQVGHHRMPGVVRVHLGGRVDGLICARHQRWISLPQKQLLARQHGPSGFSQAHSDARRPACGAGQRQFAL
jgi:hypothetical protein